MFKALFILSLIGTSAFCSDVPFVDYLATPFKAAPPAYAYPQADGISNSGLIVGSYSPYAGDSGGYFLYDSKSGSSTLFQFANGFPYFIPTGVNNSGTIIGYEGDLEYGTAQGYIGTPGGVVPLIYPGSVSTEPLAINDAGVVVGTYLDTRGASHGFIYRSNGAFQTVDAPGGQTVLDGINNVGQIVGVVSNPSQTPFLLSNGTYTYYYCGPPGFGRPSGINDSGFASSLYGALLDTATNSCVAPAVNGTKILAAVGINDSGALIAKDSNIYTPAPEPGSLAFTLGGETVVLLCIRKRSRSSQTKSKVTFSAETRSTSPGTPKRTDNVQRGVLRLRKTSCE